jgi:hypothetical protein
MFPGSDRDAELRRGRGQPEPDRPPGDAPSHLWTERMRKELSLQDHQRTLAGLQRNAQETRRRGNVLHTTGIYLITSRRSDMHLFDNARCSVHTCLWAASVTR